MNRLSFVLCILMAALVLIAGCASRITDPLIDWRPAYLAEPNETIVKDYQDYVQKLSPEEKKYLSLVEYFEDGTGQHAVMIKGYLHGKNWRHILIWR